MPTASEAADQVLEALAHEVGRKPSYYTRHVLELAEAYAWLVNPSQPHGGSVQIKS